MGQKNAKSPVKNFSKSEFKIRATRCTLMNNQTTILKISELWHLRSWLGRRHGGKYKKQKPKAVRLELGHYTIV